MILTQHGINSLKIGGGGGGDLNPLNLHAFTIRVRYEDGEDPADYFGWGVRYERIAGATGNVWDITKYDDPAHPNIKANDWSWLFSDTEGSYIQPVIEVLGANAEGVTSMSGMFAYCNTLTSVALFDTSSVTDMGSMFEGTSISTVPMFNTSACTNMNATFNNCSRLSYIPLLDTSKVVNMRDMLGCYELEPNNLEVIPLFNTSSCRYMDRAFRYCSNVKSGALALYRQVSAQGTVGTNDHYDTFYCCGENTQTGLEELNQIPESWGGNA